MRSFSSVLREYGAVDEESYRECHNSVKLREHRENKCFTEHIVSLSYSGYAVSGDAALLNGRY
jgi:hypothetical protein